MTLVELMIASSVGLVALAGVASFFVGVSRMMSTAYTEIELSINARLLREKLLFHAEAPSNGTVWSGLLSGDATAKNVPVATSSGIQMQVRGTDSAGVSQTKTLSLAPSGADGTGERWFVRDSSMTDRWLKPGGMGNLPSADVLNLTHLADKNLFSVNLDMVANGMSRRERIVVPVFGTLQVNDGSGKVFHDN